MQRCQEGIGLESGLNGGLDRCRREQNPGGTGEVNDSTHRSREGHKTDAETRNPVGKCPQLE